VNPFKNLEPKNAQNLIRLFAVGLLFWTSLTCLLPTIPAYIEDVGGTKQQVGLVMACFAIGLLLFRTSLGKMADQNSCKLVLLIGTAAVGIAPLGYILVKSIPLLMLVRVFHGISIAAFTTGYSVLVVNLSPIKQRGELIGYMSLVTPIGMAIGPALGGFLQIAVGYTPLFLISAIIGFFALILASQIQETSHTEKVFTEQENSQKTERNFREILGNISLLIPTIILLLVGLAVGAMFTFLPLFMRETLPNFNPGLFYTAAAIASFSVRSFTGRASDKIGRGLFVTISLICYTVAMLLLVIANNPASFLIAGIAEGTGGGILIPMLIALISDRSYAHERGRVYGICLGGFDLGMAIAGPIFGVVATGFSYQGVFFLAACLVIIALLIFITQSNKNIPHSFRFAMGKAKDDYAIDL
jgi:MFS family permease